MSINVLTRLRCGLGAALNSEWQENLARMRELGSHQSPMAPNSAFLRVRSAEWQGNTLGMNVQPLCYLLIGRLSNQQHNRGENSREARELGIRSRR